MKYFMYALTAMLMMFFTSSFSQVEKLDTKESYRTNLIEKNGDFVASAEFFEERIEILFFERFQNVNLFFDLTHEEFKQLGDLLQNYDLKHKDFYTIRLSKGNLYIRFTKKSNYLRSEIYMDFNNEYWYFPLMNRISYARLFQTN